MHAYIMCVFCALFFNLKHIFLYIVLSIFVHVTNECCIKCLQAQIRAEMTMTVCCWVSYELIVFKYVRLSSPTGGVLSARRDWGCSGPPLGSCCPGGSGPHVPQSVWRGDELVLREPGSQRLSGPALGGWTRSTAGGLTTGEVHLFSI